jgi:hypothetical protein
MKHVLIAFFGLVLLASCKKDKLAGRRAAFAGTWELAYMSGYIFSPGPVPPGNGKIIVIGSDGYFERRNHDTVVYRGSYILEERKDCYADVKELFFLPTDPGFPEYKISIIADSLHLNSSNCLADGGYNTYRRR